MPSPFPAARRGRPIKNWPTGFPLFVSGRRPRVVTADPWALLRDLAVRTLDRVHERIAIAHVEQAFDFFEAATTPHMGSKPLLYYYAFLNLVRAALVIRKVQIPPATTHGISDPRANVRERLRFEGQRINIHAAAHNHSQLFPEFLRTLGHTATAQRSMRVIDTLAQIPSIHRTFTQVTGGDPQFLPIKRTELLTADGEVWAKVWFERADEDVRMTLPDLRRRREFQRFFQQVTTEDGDDDHCFQTVFVRGQKKGIDNGLMKLALGFRTLGASFVLTSPGYRFYLPTTSASRRLHPLAATYASMFYFGSVVRYKPDVFDKILKGGFAWVVGELLATQPHQFLYGLASELVGVDVVRPFAKLG